MDSQRATSGSSSPPSSSNSKALATAQAINLRTLKRKVDEGIEEILLSVCHACLYQFDPRDSNRWQHRKIEGPLHVYRKSSSYGLVILNQNDIGHHNEDLSPEFEFHTDGQFLQYKNQSGQIFCIWLFEPSDVVRVHRKVNQVCDPNHQTRTPSKNVPSSRSRTTSLNITNGSPKTIGPSSLDPPVAVSAPNGITTNGHSQRMELSVADLFRLHDQNQTAAAAAKSATKSQKDIMDLLVQGYQKQKRISIHANSNHHLHHHHNNNNNNNLIHSHNHHHSNHHHHNHLLQQNNIGAHH